MPGCHINHLNCPLTQRAIGLGAHPHAAVADAGLGLCQFMGNAHDIVSRDAGQGRRPVRAQLAHCSRHLIQTVGEVGQRPGRDQIVAKQHMNHRQQKRRVGTRSNKQMLTRQFSGLGAARIDNNQLAATRFKILQSLTHIRHRPDTAVGGKRVGAQHQKVVGAIHVGDGVQEHVPETPQ